MKIVYHNDADGKCAGFWVSELAYAKELAYVTEYIGYIKMDYGREFPFDKIKKNETVYIVDYSIEPSEMDKLLEITPNVTWIDHHISAIKKYENYDKEIRGIRYDGVAGCMLTYCYLKHMTDRNIGDIKPFEESMTEDAPMFTKLIADYDVWKFEYGDNTRFFDKGFSLFPHEPEDDIWKTLLTEDSLFKIKYRGSVDEGNLPKNIQTIIDNGKTIMAYRYNIMKDYCEKKGFEATLDGHKCYAVNMALMGTDDFVIPNVDDYDLLVSFSFDGKMWSYSLRSEIIDCAELAAKFGGGGHKDAAGFNTKECVLER